MTKPVEKRQFAAFDIDGTIFRWQLYHELFDELSAAGYIDEHDKQAVLDARDVWSKRQGSFQEYEEALVRVMESSVIGLPERVIKELAMRILKSKGHRTYAYTRNLIQELRDKGYFIIAISGSYQQLVEAFAELHHIDRAIGTNYELEEGKFVRKDRIILGQKGHLLTAAASEHGLTFEGSYAVGDSGSDSAMMELVEHPIAFNPDDKLFRIAQEHGWKVVIERKNMMYELEMPKGNSEGDHGSYVLANAKSR